MYPFGRPSVYSNLSKNGFELRLVARFGLIQDAVMTTALGWKAEVKSGKFIVAEIDVRSWG